MSNDNADLTLKLEDKVQTIILNFKETFHELIMTVQRIIFH